MLISKMRYMQKKLSQSEFKKSNFLIQHGYTSLHTACHKGHIHVAEVLANSGAQIDIQTKVNSCSQKPEKIVLMIVMVYLMLGLSLLL